jgi:hypothetical protein
MRRTGRLQEIGKMQFESVYTRWTERRKAKCLLKKLEYTACEREIV